ncbi:hypothetical protein BGW80DRAFT_692373 [Lactifluus volemus]|nr:hypothetical protein BGW80DRAFT_692373 [Lactifluus volemus]
MHHERKLAKSAHKRRDYNAQRVHRARATAHKSAKKALNEKAANIIFKENNKHRKEGTVDLHGLNVPEAVQYATKELESASRRENGRVLFIVGKGLHCNVPGNVKIRPALQDLCNERGLTHFLDPKNAGCLIVQARARMPC